MKRIYEYSQSKSIEVSVLSRDGEIAGHLIKLRQPSGTSRVELVLDGEVYQASEQHGQMSSAMMSVVYSLTDYKYYDWKKYKKLNSLTEYAAI